MKTLQADTDFMEGAVILIDKPAGWSSFDVVKKIRNLLHRKQGRWDTRGPWIRWQRDS
jgi:tRNA pseudouridine55 synthase